MKNKLITSIAYGDAYGAPFEFAPIEFINQYNDGKHLIGNHRCVAGQYTDDTQMSLAVAECILANKPNTTLHPIMFANWFYKVDTREGSTRGGYSSRVRIALSNSNSGTEFFNSITNLNSNSNGSVMRVLPCAILPTMEEVQNAAISQGIITHLHYDAMEACRVVALTLHSIIYDTKIKTIDGHIRRACAHAEIKVNKYLKDFKIFCGRCYYTKPFTGTPK